MKGRLIYRDILTHCYQRTADRGVLFYTVSDFLVHFTIYCIMARKYNIKVFAMCQMPDHVHDSIMSHYKRNVSLFKCEVNKRFSRAWNMNASLSGRVPLELPGLRAKRPPFFGKACHKVFKSCNAACRQRS
ncbi:MAG: transposase [Bacteroidales bacterium]|nr:transposase [Bacteroidales bacterium]